MRRENWSGGCGAGLWDRVAIRCQTSASRSDRTPHRHERRYASSLRPSSRRAQEAHSRFRRRQPVLRRGSAAVARGGARPWDLRAACRQHARLARCLPRPAFARGADQDTRVCDLLRLRGRQRPRPAQGRSAVEDRRRPCARERCGAVLAIDDEPAGEHAEPNRGGAAHGLADRPVLRLLRDTARRDHARHRRYGRRGARRPAAVVLECAPRCALLSADAHLSRRERQAGGHDPACRQDAERGGGAPSSST
jgi:hypothetical protein